MLFISTQQHAPSFDMKNNDDRGSFVMGEKWTCCSTTNIVFHHQTKRKIKMITIRIAKLFSRPQIQNICIRHQTFNIGNHHQTINTITFTNTQSQSSFKNQRTTPQLRWRSQLCHDAFFDTNSSFQKRLHSISIETSLNITNNTIEIHITNNTIEQNYTEYP
jgi:hypothetical protein